MPITDHIKHEFDRLQLNCHLGLKICRNCVRKVHNHDISQNSAHHDMDLDFVPTAQSLVSEPEFSKLNESISSFDSPIKADILKLSVPQRSKYVHEKSDRHREKFNSAVSQLAGISSPPTPDDALQHDRLMSLLKEKIGKSPRREQVKMLTLVPDDWSRKHVAEKFNVSERQVREARLFKKDLGILPDVGTTNKGNKTLSDEIKNAVNGFYKDSEFVRIMPGAKSVVANWGSSGKEYEPQRLILCNLKELHSNFLQQHPDHKIGLSKFCQLRPKFCKTVDSGGSHSVCVCTIHQNFKFCVEKVPTINHYTDILKILVCDIKNELCMVSKCENCPGKSIVESRLAEIFSDNYDPSDVIQYSQWVTTDRSTIVTNSATVLEFIEIVASQAEKVASHHFVKEEQSKYLKNLKANLDCSEIIIQMDFAENYTFLVQDAAQSFHWNNEQATLHPIVVYHKDVNNELAHTSYIYISDVLKHDHTAVHTMMSDLVPNLKDTLPHPLHKVHYFTDGCAGQYKSYKALNNLIYHKQDFGVDAVWHYFATSHGKSACDGIGAVVKYQARRASLQRVSSNQILTARDLFNFSKESITKVNTLWLDGSEVSKHEAQQEKRHANAPSVPGIRNHHSFRCADKVLFGSRTSTSAPTIKIRYGGTQLNNNSTNDRLLDLASMKPGSTVAYAYNNKWYIGSIMDTSEENHDIYINSMLPHGPSKVFRYPERADQLWVPLMHVITHVNMNTSNFRQFTLNEEVQQQIMRGMVPPETFCNQRLDLKRCLLRQAAYVWLPFNEKIRQLDFEI